ncbi:MAG: phosphatase PAP2 family protein [Verrucomicrobiales bacterium]|nr:phosphatase PAP2 family protein [Verrucomicrobiales bacterium]
MEDFLYSIDWVLPFRNPSITPVMKAITALGYTWFFFLVLPLLYWIWDKNAATRVMTALIFSGLITFFLKDLFEDPRPPKSLWLAGESPTSYGLPSGHTLMAIVFWFSLALEFKVQWFTRLAFLLVFLIPLSRLYLGVHDLEDIIAGAVAGVATLIFFRFLLRAETLRGLTRTAILLSVMAAIVLALWPAAAPPGKSIIMMGLFAGWMAGYLLDFSSPFFKPAKRWMKLPVAIVGLFLFGLVIWLLRKYLLALHLAPLLSEIIAGVVLGFTITALFPFLCSRFRSMRA